MKLGTIIADFRTALAVKMAVGATTGTLQSATDDDSVALPAGRYFFTIDGDNSQKEHISCDLSSTALTNIKSISRQGAETTGVVREHRVGASVVITNFAHIKVIGDVMAGTLPSSANNLSIGDETNTNKTITFDAGEPSSKDPQMRYNSTTNQIEFRRYGETSFTVIPLSLRGTYADYASLPTDASDGDLAITTDDYKLYAYDLGNTTWKLAGGTAGAGLVYRTDKLGSESDGGDLKTFTLTAGTWTDINSLLVYKNGQLQRIGASYDYTEIDSNTIQFTYTLASDDLVSMVVISIGN